MQSYLYICTQGLHTYPHSSFQCLQVLISYPRKLTSADRNAGAQRERLSFSDCHGKSPVPSLYTVNFSPFRGKIRQCLLANVISVCLQIYFQLRRAFEDHNSCKNRLAVIVVQRGFFGSSLGHFPKFVSHSLSLCSWIFIFDGHQCLVHCHVPGTCHRCLRTEGCLPWLCIPVSHLPCVFIGKHLPQSRAWTGSRYTINMCFYKICKLIKILQIR